MNIPDIAEWDAEEVSRATARTKVSLVGFSDDLDHETPYPVVHTYEYVVTDGAWTKRLHNEDSHDAFCKHMEFALEVSHVCEPEYNGNGCYHFTALNFGGL